MQRLNHVMRSGGVMKGCEAAMTGCDVAIKSCYAKRGCYERMRSGDGRM